MKITVKEPDKNEGGKSASCSHFNGFLALWYPYKDKNGKGGKEGRLLDAYIVGCYSERNYYIETYFFFRRNLYGSGSFILGT